MQALPRRRVRRLHLFFNGAVLLGLVLQIYAAGLMFYGLQRPHRTLGWALMAGAAIGVPISLWAYGLARETFLSLALAGLLVLQPVAVFVLAPRSPFLGALHASNAALAVLVSAAILSARFRSEDRR